MFWGIIIFLGLWIQPLAAEVLQDTTFNVGGTLEQQLDSYSDLWAQDVHISDEETTYFALFYGPSAPHAGQRGDIGNRTLVHASKVGYPIKAGLKDDHNEKYPVYPDNFRVRLVRRQGKQLSYVASFTAALAEVLYDFMLRGGERRQQLGEHMITWKRDKKEQIKLSPVENLREDVQNLNYMLSRGMMSSWDALILAETAELATKSLYALIQQGNASFIPIRQIQEADK